MKVLLLQDVKGVGKKGEVKEVNQGYGNNLLIPRKLARPATGKDEEVAKKLLKQREEHKKVQDDLIGDTIRQLKGKSVTLKAKSSETGHLFSKIHEDEIVTAVKDQLQLSIEKNWLKLPGQIKEVGEHDISVAHGYHKSNFTLVVESDK